MDEDPPKALAEAKARIEAERATAEIWFNEQVKSLPQIEAERADSERWLSEWVQNRAAFDRILLGYVDYMFFAYADELFDAGLKLKWPVPEVRERIEKALVAVIDEAFSSKHPGRDTAFEPEWQGDFRRSATDYIRASDDWRDLQTSLKEMAVSDEDEAPALQNLAQPFHRIRDDLRQLLDTFPTTGEVTRRRDADGGSKEAQERQQAGTVDLDTAPSPTPADRHNEESRRLADWGAIEISFLSDERVQIRNGPNTETRNYAELGFNDRRNGTPNQAWLTLRGLAEARGIMRDATGTGRDWPKIEKRMQEIRKALRTHFAIPADPVPFVDGTGYQACFKIGCSPSFHT